jgi:hypothetical protein
MDEGGDNQKRRDGLPADVAVLSLIGAGFLLLVAWSIINNPRFSRIVPAEIVVFAVSLALAFGLSFGVGIRSRGVQRWLLLCTAVASATLIVLIACGGIASLLRE